MSEEVIYTMFCWKVGDNRPMSSGLITHVLFRYMTDHPIWVNQYQEDSRHLGLKASMYSMYIYEFNNWSSWEKHTFKSRAELISAYPEVLF